MLCGQLWSSLALLQAQGHLSKLKQWRQLSRAGHGALRDMADITVFLQERAYVMYGKISSLAWRRVKAEMTWTQDFLQEEPARERSLIWKT